VADEPVHQPHGAASPARARESIKAGPATKEQPPHHAGYEHFIDPEERLRVAMARQKSSVPTSSAPS